MPRRLIATALLLLSAATARADVAVLVHGYLGSPFSWGDSGVHAALATQGWQPPGPPAAAGTANGNTVYTMDLPSIAPLLVQADILTRALRDIESRHPGEKVTLVGHSAGGVVARLALVRGGPGQVKRLITIAAPHLGTERALEALDATHDSCPIGMIKDFFGGGLYHTVKASSPLLVDLTPAVPGSLLYWLNAQPHPDIDGFAGDVVVPGFSQDMNQVPALRGRSRLVAAPSPHELLPGDGPLLAMLLRD